MNAYLFEIRRLAVAYLLAWVRALPRWKIHFIGSTIAAVAYLVEFSTPSRTRVHEVANEVVFHALMLTGLALLINGRPHKVLRREKSGG